jgi:hypothetical protein
MSRAWALATAMAVVAAACGNETPPLPPVTASPPFDPADAPMRRLLASQYTASIGVMFGATAAQVATPPGDNELHGYTTIGAAQLSMTDDLVATYEISARAVASAAMGEAARIAELLDCSPQGPGDRACMESFVGRAGRLAFRRPLAEEEVERFADVGMAASQQLGDFYAGVELAIVALLQAPSFLFVVETGSPIPAEPAKSRLDGYELAARMSLFLVGAGPDEALLDAVAAGELDTPEGVREAARSLLGDPRARAALRHFFDEYLVLRDLGTTSKDPSRFPSWSPALAASMREETMRLMADIVWKRDADLRELLTADYTFVDERLAALYGVDPPESGSSESGWARVTLPTAQGRSGLLTHASILSRQAHATSTSPTYRGLFVLERFLCKTMPSAPNDVVTELPPSSTAPTMRERLAVHLEDPSCASCHAPVDPIGLALENFDSIGEHRTKENGATIDASVDHPYLGSFDGAQSLALALLAREELASCIVRNLHRHATGHVETKGELPAIDALVAGFVAGGHRLQPLLVDLVSSELFRTVATVDGGLSE